MINIKNHDQKTNKEIKTKRSREEGDNNEYQ
jgi:hypothetical protein